MSEIRRRTVAGLKPGDSFSVTRRFTEEDTLRFGRVTRDYNPVHYDDRFAASKGLPGRICHGLLVGALLTEIGGQIGWLASGMNFRFLAPVPFNETVTCTLTIDRIGPHGRANASVVFKAADDRRIATAELFGILPSDADRRVIQQMVDEGDPTNGPRS